MQINPINKTITLNFTNINVKGILKEKFSDGGIGWIRLDDFTVKKIEDLPITTLISDWQELLKLDNMPEITEKIGAIIEIYENYESFLSFKQDLTIGDIDNKEWEDLYNGTHFQ